MLSTLYSCRHLCFHRCRQTTPFTLPQIVRMYKRMADGGYLAKEPGMGAADIAKAYTR